MLEGREEDDIGTDCVYLESQSYNLYETLVCYTSGYQICICRLLGHYALF